MDTTPIRRAVDLIGGHKRLAEALGVTPSLISQWVSGRRPVAARHVRKIEELCGHEVTCQELLPEVFGDLPPASNDADGNAGAEGDQHG